MRILQICSKIPFPSKDGGSLAMNMLTKGLAESGHDVQVLAINTPKHFIRDEEIDPEYRKRTNYRSVFIDTAVKPLSAFLNLFSGKSYNVSRFYSAAFEKELLKVLSEKEFDIIQLESIWVTPYLDAIRNNTKAKIILRSHNVEYEVWERLAAQASSLKKIYLSMLAKRLKDYELKILNSYDAILAITRKDMETFVKAGCRIPCIHIPFGFEPSKYTADNPGKPGSVFHIGAMDWMPNQDAVNWMLKDIWPRVFKKVPNVTLHLAGRKMPGYFFKEETESVVVHFEVEDAIAFMKQFRVMVVPLSSGGGMRVKIIEGMALGRTIISTRIGAEGIVYEHGKDILIAETTEEFVSAITKCLNDPEYTEGIGKNARAMVEDKYDNTKLCRTLSGFYSDLLKK